MFDEEEKKSGGSMTDLARKILLTGVGAIFMTEESVRKALGDLKLPTDAVGSMMDTVKKQKDEVLEIVGKELSRFFSHIRVHEELQKALKGLTVHLDATVSFDQKGSSQPKAKVTLEKK